MDTLAGLQMTGSPGNRNFIKDILSIIPAKLLIHATKEIQSKTVPMKLLAILLSILFSALTHAAKPNILFIFAGALRS